MEEKGTWRLIGRREETELKAGAVAIVVHLCFPSSLAYSHPSSSTLPLVPKRDCSIYIVTKIGIIFALLSLHYFIIGCKFKPGLAAPLRQRLSPVPSVALSAVHGAVISNLHWTSWVILLQEDTTQLNFSRQLKWFVFLSFFCPHSCGNTMFLQT